MSGEEALAKLNISSNKQSNDDDDDDDDDDSDIDEDELTWNIKETKIHVIVVTFFMK